ncbi:MAG: DUF4380 domain-containing protein [Deltaproteobacteria bacterium]|nr:DUF4380 domain-containing protein [Deltaproteobacteria bacterium]
MRKKTLHNLIGICILLNNGWLISGCSSDGDDSGIIVVDAFVSVDSARPEATAVADASASEDTTRPLQTLDSAQTLDSGQIMESGQNETISDVAEAQLIEPIERSGKLVLEFENVLFECDPSIAGRITAFSLKGNNILTGPEIHAENFGSTFWTSPQSDWNWPPPAEIDSEPYTAELMGSTIQLSGSANPSLGMRITKRYTPELRKRAIAIEYVIENTKTEAIRIAPWEVSRVLPGGLSFFVKGTSDFGSREFAPLDLVEAAGVTWFEHRPDSIQSDQKLFADGKDGWIAHVAGDMIFIKKFDDIAAEQRAPDEAEIEIYACPSYVEIEQQGAYQEIAAGQSLSWKVIWYLRQLPQGLIPSLGNEQLISLVQETIR